MFIAVANSKQTVGEKKMLINICRKIKLPKTKPASTYYVMNVMDNILRK